jgi:U3 small nucleolar RNA-associated protein 14
MKRKLGTKKAVMVEEEKYESDDDEESADQMDQASDDDISDQEEAADFDEESDDGEIDDVHSRLLAAIDKFSSQPNESSEEHTDSSTKKLAQNRPESVFASTSNMNVSMNALLQALDGSQGISAVKKKLSDFEKSLNIPTFVEKTTSQRAERSLTYIATANEQNKWQDIVTSNRHEKTLDLAQDRRQLPSMKHLITKFEASNDLEKEIQMVLFKTSATEATAAKVEEDELLARGQTLEEIRQKQAELAKVKARMFYDQMKRHRINKIKSKAFHRIKKRQRQRQESKDMERIIESDADQARLLMEEQAKKRIKERMDLKHKNTGKWARMALEHGRRDPSIREAYHEAVQLGRDLLAKHDEVDANDDPDADLDNDKDGDENFSSNDDDDGVTAKAAAALKKIVQPKGSNSQQAPIDGKFQKLFNMDFMKKADKQQQLRLEEDAKNILRELENIESSSDVDDSDRDRDDDDEEDMIFQKKTTKARTQVSFGDGPLTIGETNVKLTSSSSSKKGRLTADSEDAASNPWLAPVSTIAAATAVPTSSSSKESNPQPNAKKRRQPKALKSVATATATATGTGKPTATLTEVAGATKDSSSNVTVPSSGANNPPKANESKLPERKPLLSQKSQADLVQMAFAGPNLEEEFTALKNQSIDEELGFDAKRKDVLSKGIDHSSHFTSMIRHDACNISQ